MYASQADLEKRFGTDEILRLSDRNHDQQIDSDVVQAALDDAHALINGRLANHPMLSVQHTSLLKSIACDIARHRLYDDGITQTVQQRYEQAIDQLESLVSSQTNVTLAEKNMPRIFTRTTMKDF